MVSSVLVGVPRQGNDITIHSLPIHFGKSLIGSFGGDAMPQDDIPADVQKSITHWSQLVDYWAVDWDFKGDTFHNQWQAYRTRKQSKLEVVAKHEYEAKGRYTVLVKVIDLLGNDTTKILTVEVM